MEPPQMENPPVGYELVLLAKEAASSFPSQVDYLKDVASIVIDLANAAKVRPHSYMLSTGWQTSCSPDDIGTARQRQEPRCIRHQRHCVCCQNLAVVSGVKQLGALDVTQGAARCYRRYYTVCPHFCFIYYLIDLLCRAVRSVVELVKDKTWASMEHWRLVHRIKIAWNGRKMKAYCAQLTNGESQAQVRSQISIDTRAVTFEIYRPRYSNSILIIRRQRPKS